MISSSNLADHKPPKVLKLEFESSLSDSIFVIPSFKYPSTRLSPAAAPQDSDGKENDASKNHCQK